MKEGTRIGLGFLVEIPNMRGNFLSSRKPERRKEFQARMCGTLEKIAGKKGSPLGAWGWRGKDPPTLKKVRRTRGGENDARFYWTNH